MSRIILPLYIYPSPRAWDFIVHSAQEFPSVGISAVVNPSNGSGEKSDQNYVLAIDQLEVEENISLFGYVDTNYAKKALSEVRRDIETWHDIYPKVKGIFFDQVASSHQETYYSLIDSSAKSLGYGFTIANPGIEIEPSMIGIMNSFVIWENSSLPKIDKLFGKFKQYNKSNFGVIVHSQSKYPTHYVKELARYAEFIYITSGTEPNPYSSVPYLLQLCESLSET